MKMRTKMIGKNVHENLDDNKIDFVSENLMNTS